MFVVVVVVAVVVVVVVVVVVDVVVLKKDIQNVKRKKNTFFLSLQYFYSYSWVHSYKMIFRLNLKRVPRSLD